ncbi:hypothetical protein HK100_012210 [Physocladia obscura]|uniref:Uncharacterized protein n=1 Tax=Physocladia obscura TaxID=109957 RepID=A0AAD5XK27_9FUNG|nr:hypothetical protein HK100_012210 [Physocladia obscura]
MFKALENKGIPIPIKSVVGLLRGPQHQTVRSESQLINHSGVYKSANYGGTGTNRIRVNSGSVRLRQSYQQQQLQRPDTGVSVTDSIPEDDLTEDPKRSRPNSAFYKFVNSSAVFEEPSLERRKNRQRKKTTLPLNIRAIKTHELEPQWFIVSLFLGQPPWPTYNERRYLKYQARSNSSYFSDAMIRLFLANIATAVLDNFDRTENSITANSTNSVSQTSQLLLQIIPFSAAPLLAIFFLYLIIKSNRLLFVQPLAILAYWSIVAAYLLSPIEQFSCVFPDAFAQSKMTAYLVSTIVMAAQSGLMPARSFAPWSVSVVFLAMSHIALAQSWDGGSSVIAWGMAVQVMILSVFMVPLVRAFDAIDRDTFEALQTVKCCAELMKISVTQLVEYKNEESETYAEGNIVHGISQCKDECGYNYENGNECFGYPAHFAYNNYGSRVGFIHETYNTGRDFSFQRQNKPWVNSGQESGFFNQNFDSHRSLISPGSQKLQSLLDQCDLWISEVGDPGICAEEIERNMPESESVKSDIHSDRATISGKSSLLSKKRISSNDVANQSESISNLVNQYISSRRPSTVNAEKYLANQTNHHKDLSLRNKSSSVSVVLQKIATDEKKFSQDSVFSHGAIIDIVPFDDSTAIISKTEDDSGRNSNDATSTTEILEPTISYNQEKEKAVNYPVIETDFKVKKESQPTIDLISNEEIEQNAAITEIRDSESSLSIGRPFGSKGSVAPITEQETVAPITKQETVAPKDNNSSKNEIASELAQLKLEEAQILNVTATITAEEDTAVTPLISAQEAADQIRAKSVFSMQESVFDGEVAVTPAVSSPSNSAEMQAISAMVTATATSTAKMAAATAINVATIVNNRDPTSLIVKEFRGPRLKLLGALNDSESLIDPTESRKAKRISDTSASSRKEFIEFDRPMHHNILQNKNADIPAAAATESQQGEPGLMSSVSSSAASMGPAYYQGITPPITAQGSRVKETGLPPPSLLGMVESTATINGRKLMPILGPIRGNVPPPVVLYEKKYDQ